MNYNHFRSLRNSELYCFSKPEFRGLFPDTTRSWCVDLALINMSSLRLFSCLKMQYNERWGILILYRLRWAFEINLKWKTVDFIRRNSEHISDLLVTWRSTQSHWTILRASLDIICYLESLTSVAVKNRKISIRRCCYPLDIDFETTSHVFSSSVWGKTNGKSCCGEHYENNQK